MQMSWHDMYYNHTMRSLLNKINGYFEAENHKEQQNWERSRWEVYNMINIQLDRKNRLKTVKDICLFPWEAEEKPAKVQLTQQQFEQLIK